ncbi:SGNH/GDSL hydrolase family protein [Geodermatophilus sp. SYSU D00766]
MRGLDLERPPRWGIVALLALVLVNAAVFAGMALRPAAEDPYGPTRLAAASAPTPAPAAGTPAPVDAATSPEPASTPVLAVYGDGYAAGNPSGGLGPAGWPAQVAASVGAELSLHAVARAGYAALGVTGEDLPAVVRANPVPDAAVTVLFGSRNDGDESTPAVEANASAAIAAVRQQAPDTVLLVVGPVWSDGDVPAGVVAARDAVRSAAEAAGAEFVDPVAEGWFADVTGLIATDGVSPTDQGHAYLAERIAPAVEAALAGTSGPTA